MLGGQDTRPLSEIFETWVINFIICLTAVIQSYIQSNVDTYNVFLECYTCGLLNFAWLLSEGTCLTFTEQQCSDAYQSLSGPTHVPGHHFTLTHHMSPQTIHIHIFKCHILEYSMWKMFSFWLLISMSFLWDGLYCVRYQGYYW